MISKVKFSIQLICFFLVAVALCTGRNTTGSPARESVACDTSMLYIQNERVKVGINLSLGGALTYLSDKANGGMNMINNHDWGRQVQMSYYSGPWPYVGPNGERPSPEWEGLGWNPIQSGDAGGNRSKVISYEKRGNHAIFVRSIPMQWPHKTGVRGECIFECLYTLHGNVVQMEATIVNNRPDKTQYPAAPQEMPAVYTNGPWYKLVSYLGDKPFSGEPATVIVNKNDKKGWPWMHFYTPENWVALLDDHGYGIGVFQPETMQFNGGFHPNDLSKGYGGEKDGQTGHIAPVGRQIIDHNIRWTYKTSLILGTLDDIRSFAKANWQNNSNPDWNFRRSRDSWYYRGELKDSGFPLGDGLNLKFGKGASMIGPETYWRAAGASLLEITGRFETGNGTLELIVEIQPVGQSDFTDWLNWSEGELDVDKEKVEKAARFPKKAVIAIRQVIVTDGINRKYPINLSKIKGYTGAMKNLKITFSDNGNAVISRIRLHK